MSEFDACVARAVESGEIDPIRGEKARKAYREHFERRRRQGLDEDAAILQAEMDAKAQLAREAAERRHREVRQLQAMTRISENLRGYRNGVGEMDPARALAALMERDHLNRFSSVEGVRQGLEADYKARFAEALRAFAPDIIGRRGKPAMMSDMLEAAHGKATTPEAKALADAWKAAAERARLDFNAAGGHIGELSDWGLPHSHDRARILKAGEDVWTREIYERAAWDRIENFETGRPFAADGWPKFEQVQPFLKDMYQRITTDGWSARNPSGAQGGASLANRRAEHRTLHMKSGRDWEIYNAKFGAHDPMTTMVLHLQGMARDTALMRIYGPNPKAGAAFAQQTALKMAHMGEAAQPGPIRRRLGDDAVSRVNDFGQLAKRMMEHYEGAAMQPADKLVATWLSGGRQFLVAAQLGGATLASVPSDVLNVAAHVRSFGGSGTAALGRVMRMYASPENRRLAQRAGLVMDHLMGVGAAEARFVGQVWTPESSAMVSEAVMRASFLTQTTSFHRHAFQLEFMGLLADHADKGFRDIHPDLRRRLELHGITPEDWEKIRQTPRLYQGEAEGDGFLAPMHITDRDLSIRMQALMAEETELAVPSTSLRARAQFVGGDPGTVGGELTRSAFMYKNFAFSIFFNQIKRRFYEEETRGRGAMRAASFAAFATMKWAALMTVAGAMSIQLKEVAKGRDPRPMTSDDQWMKFLGASILQGGGLGIFGDFISSTENRFGGGLAGTAAGPMVGAIGDLGALTIGNVLEAAEGKETSAGREATRFLRRYTPGGSIWWASLAYNRLVLDELQEMLDPEAAAAFRSAERKRVREYGNAAWWTPGEAAPSRAPDPAAALGG